MISPPLPAQYTLPSPAQHAIPQHSSPSLFQDVVNAGHLVNWWQDEVEVLVDPADAVQDIDKLQRGDTMHVEEGFACRV